MSLPGFDALGHWSLAHPPEAGVSVSVNLAGVAGTGVARALTPAVDKALTGVSGTGVAGSLKATDDKTLTGVAGIGVANAITGQIDKSIIGVAGVGVAGSFVPFVSIAITGVAGIGIARAMTPAVDVGALSSAVGIGVANPITPGPSGNFSGVAGIGVAGRITVSISGSGTSSAAPSGHRKKTRSGFDQIKKDYRPPEPPDEPKLPIPPTRFVRKSPPIQPRELVDPILLPDDVLQLEQTILNAHRISDAIRDEQDAADIADLMALLRELETA